MLRVHVYTATIGDTDALRDPSIAPPGVRYFCASDTEVESDVWQRIKVDPGPDPVMAARRFKSLLHDAAGHADFYLWIDAPFRLDVDPRIFTRDLLHHDVLVLEHPWRDSIEQEAQELARKKLAPADVTGPQAKAYRAQGFPEDTPLSSTGFLVRRNDRRTQAMNRRWWAELQKWQHARDQMSFDYVAWKAGQQVGRLEGTYRNNPYALWGESREAA